MNFKAQDIKYRPQIFEILNRAVGIKDLLLSDKESDTTKCYDYIIITKDGDRVRLGSRVRNPWCPEYDDVTLRHKTENVKIQNGIGGVQFYALTGKGFNIRKWILYNPKAMIKNGYDFTKQKIGYNHDGGYDFVKIPISDIVKYGGYIADRGYLIA